MSPLLADRTGSLMPQWRLDPWLMGMLLVLMGFGMLVLYSAGEQQIGLVWRQAVRLGMGLVILVVLAHVPPRLLRLWAPWLFLATLLTLVAVLLFGVGRGAQRWLDLGVIRFQPSEAMKLALPLMLALLFYRRSLPPNWSTLFMAAALIALPVALIVMQPDLGTSVLIGASGVCMLFLAGLRWRLILLMLLGLAAIAPVLWLQLHQYQRHRILTFLSPESDPLGQGWNIIQSKIAVGSGGLTGKGWLAGSQSHLEFLPEPHTDFIFSVLAEEFGFVGVLVMLALYAGIVGRGMYLASQCRDSFGRLLAGSLVFMFFLYVAVNVGMISGLLPVVGVPLPLVSYGGTSAVTLLAAFGIVMGLYSRRRFMG
ncbi:rod shape-determining protein RodA [Wenzhouxiangella sp. AB-CW3]|uniref:rod shape-determining protein RodA n=1 Tax=Wenzhouxiangella sp. AB-CW3 TaxID=2771012 RepID=UPI001CC2B487|nr:rod shape-determining protein RodA [Wenzhouxiangella sp. AB-CW3]